MASWRVELTPAAVRRLRRVRADELLALHGVILALADDRRPPGARKLRGTDLWRIRLRIDGAPWRVVYEVRARERLVVVTRVARRDEATYRRLD
ncbi:MAG: type II toxin-antitoxin system RelE family toxin [Candidatus Limnocylindria bacterium]